MKGQNSLSPEDITFFSDEDNWRYGPCYEIALFIEHPISDEEMGKLLHEELGFIPWTMTNSPQRSYSIFRDARDRIPAFGLLHFPWHYEPDSLFPNQPQHRYFFVLYPAQFIRICGDYPHFEGGFDGHDYENTRCLILCLMRVIQSVGKYFNVSGAAIQDETYAMPFLKDGITLSKGTLKYLQLPHVPALEEYERYGSVPLNADLDVLEKK